MSSQPGHSISPPPNAAASAATGVRRHHTISSSSRNARPTSKIAINEVEDSQNDQAWNDDEVVDQDWVGGIGAVGEKSSLHRQASLPTRYHRAFGGQAARQGGNYTPRTLNSLTAIAGHEGDEEEWEREMRGLRNEDNVSQSSSTSDQGHGAAEQPSSSASPLSPHFAGGPPVPSPPPAAGATGVRRHQSLNYPNAAGGVRRLGSGLKRAGTLQAPPIKGAAPGGPYAAAQSPSPTNAEEEYDNESVRAEEDSYFALQTQQGQYVPQSPIGRSSPWATPGAGTDWRAQIPSSGSIQSGPVDDVTRALSTLELNQQYNSGGGYQQGQSAHPPRFNPPHPPPLQAPGMRNGSGNGQRKPLNLVTDFDERQAQLQQSASQSAAAYVPPIGHGFSQTQNYTQNQRQQGGDDRPNRANRDRAMTASGGSSGWEQKEQLVTGRASNPNLHNMYQGNNGAGNIPNVPPIPAQYLNNNKATQAPRMGASTPSNSQGGYQSRGSDQGSQTQGASGDGYITSPIDIPNLIKTKGYNPIEFDTRPLFARYFVIKSYTEDDVHKSLKYEIWSSTDPGNKRLDKAFKETASRGPIYLFFSVNASGHFCGMAEMLTPVDYTRSSTVWASDKWKGVFKVRWIFVRDIPNATLRHIRLNNTQERKPVTNSRDTQELLPDAGQEMLRIFFTHPARTSLLQDFAFYELQAMQKAQASGMQPMPQGMSSPTQTPATVHTTGNQSQGISPTGSPGQQHPFAMANPTALAYATQHMGMAQMNMGMGMGMTPMMGMGMGMGGFATPHAMQSVMRHPPSPGPMPVGQNYMNMGGMGF